MPVEQDIDISKKVRGISGPDRICVLKPYSIKDDIKEPEPPAPEDPPVQDPPELEKMPEPPKGNDVTENLNWLVRVTDWTRKKISQK